MTDAHHDPDHGGIDGPVAIVSEPKRIVLSSGKKIGIAVLATLIFLIFIWVDHLQQAHAAGKQPELSARPDAGAFNMTPLALPPTQDAVEEQRPSAPITQKNQDGSPEQSAVLAYAGGAANALPSVAANASSIAPSGEIVPALAKRTQAPATSPADGSLASRLKPTVLEGNRAELLAHPDMLITKGTIIPCTLQTAINSELAGYVKCVLPEAVRSTTGQVVLLDRGTTVVGELQSGMSTGQKRAFILWDRAETPDHAVISLASPGSDELGRSGVPGVVNNHFLERFGGAMMLTILQGGLQAGTALAANPGSGNGTNFNSFQSNGQEVVNSALQSTMNIPPVLEKNQGDTVSIFVARDLDFSDVYSLSLTDPQ